MTKRLWMSVGALVLGCGLQSTPEKAWQLEVQLPDSISKSSVRTERFTAIAGKLNITVRQGQWVRCEREIEFSGRTRPALEGCAIAATDSKAFLISVVLLEKGKRRQLAYARAHLRPADLAKQDSVGMKLILSVPVKEFDPDKKP